MNQGFDRSLCDAAWVGGIPRIELLLQDPLAVADADPATTLLHAAHRGHHRAVALLLPHAAPFARDSEALWRAARFGRMWCIDLLVPVSHPERWAAWQWADLPQAGRKRVEKRLAALGRGLS